ncbi:hypothetical protein emb_1d0619 [Coriobacteriaceae bacterium EMTCatB1]|nr:hypothetical protein emb_1d0619 [Coriobacteriaceae bacterium EMTCatB1]
MRPEVGSMNGNQRTARVMLTAIGVALLISLAAPAFAATPTQPVLRDVFVTPRASLLTSPTVTVQWTGSRTPPATPSCTTSTATSSRSPARPSSRAGSRPSPRD